MTEQPQPDEKVKPAGPHRQPDPHRQMAPAGTYGQQQVLFGKRPKLGESGAA